jgi:hypothetical protein
MVAAMSSLKRMSGMELLAFAVILTCMILMRFGY